MYHVIATAPAGVAYPDLFVSPVDFEGEMDWLAVHHFHAVTLHRVYEYWLRGTQLPPHPIVLSFDDGTLGQHTHAFPVLRSLHWPGVLNLKVNALNSRFTLSAWRVREMVAAGWELDAHTLTHPDLTTVDAARLREEVTGSRSAIRKMFRVPVNFFCYPAGRYDPAVVAAVKRAGYLGATTTNFGNAGRDQLLTLNRVRINRSDRVPGFERKLTDLRTAGVAPAPPSFGGGGE